MRDGSGRRLTGILLFLGLLVAPAEAKAQPADLLARVFQAIHSGQVRVVDLSYPLDDQSPYWPGASTRSPFHASIAATFSHDGYSARTLTLPEHFGTHMDAPAHFDPNGLTVDRVPVKNLLAAVVVVDVSEAAKSDPDYRVSVADLEKWVKAHGAIPRGCVVLFRTGWGARWPSQKDYMNQDSQGVLHFPGLSLEAARYLLDHAHPVGIGIDTASVDNGPSKNFEVHHLTMAAGLYHLETLANLEQLPPTGVYLMVSPLALRGGSGSPARVVALYSKSSPASQPH